MTRAPERVFLAVRAIATAVLVVSLLEGTFLGSSSSTSLGTLDKVILHLSMIASIWWPRIGALSCLAIAPIDIAIHRYAGISMAAPLAVFATIIAGRVGYAALAGGTALATSVFVWVAPPHYPDLIWPISLFVLVAAGLGAAVSYMLRTQQRTEARSRAVLQLHHESTRAMHQRLARQLHDSIGHAFAVSSSIAAHHARRADAAEAEAFERIRSTCAEGAGHLAEAVALLREEANNQPTLQGKPSLIAATMADTLNECGHQVDTRVDPSINRVDQETSEFIARFLTEATTNVLKHGTGRGTVTFAASATPTSYVVTVTNPVRANAATRPGRGLVLLRLDAVTIDAEITWRRTGNSWTTTLAGTLEDVSEFIGPAPNTDEAPAREGR